MGVHKPCAFAQVFLLLSALVGASEQVGREDLPLMRGSACLLARHVK
jgi:hypothetical protein